MTILGSSSTTRIAASGDSIVEIIGPRTVDDKCDGSMTGSHRGVVSHAEPCGVPIAGVPEPAGEMLAIGGY